MSVNGWEYKIFRIGQSDIDHAEDIINQFGREGWELVAVNLDRSFYFKREILG